MDIIGVNLTTSGQVPDSRSDDVNFPSGPPGYFLGITFENSQRSASYGPQADQAYIYGIHNVSGQKVGKLEVQFYIYTGFE
jgi:hypothetical protein